MQFLPSINGLYNLVCFCSGWYWLFLSMCSTSFKSSCWAGLVVTKSLNINLSIKNFISPSLMKLRLAGYEFLGWKFFSLRMVTMARRSGKHLQFQPFGRLRREDCLNQGVPDQHEQHSKTPSLPKIKKKLVECGGAYLWSQLLGRLKHENHLRPGVPL